jgi:hypothetical protein
MDGAGKQLAQEAEGVGITGPSHFVQMQSSRNE